MESQTSSRLTKRDWLFLLLSFIGYAVFFIFGALRGSGVAGWPSLWALLQFHTGIFYFLGPYYIFLYVVEVILPNIVAFALLSRVSFPKPYRFLISVLLVFFIWPILTGFVTYPFAIYHEARGQQQLREEVAQTQDIPFSISAERLVLSTEPYIPAAATGTKYTQHLLQFDVAITAPEDAYYSFHPTLFEPLNDSGDYKALSALFTMSESGKNGSGQSNGAKPYHLTAGKHTLQVTFLTTTCCSAQPERSGHYVAEISLYSYGKVTAYGAPDYYDGYHKVYQSTPSQSLSDRKNGKIVTSTPDPSAPGTDKLYPRTQVLVTRTYTTTDFLN